MVVLRQTAKTRQWKKGSLTNGTCLTGCLHVEECK
ncbi:hypothetical protein T09_13060 [Trichinella sp. T9]|nr:hypothetical protein T09_13060 [Trichinella sp. T9]